MEVFLNIVIFFILAALLASLLLRYLLPWLLRRFVKRSMKQFGENLHEQQNYDEDRQSGKTFGNIKVDYIPKNDNQKKADVDEEYVDFEEINEK